MPAPVPVSGQGRAVRWLVAVLLLVGLAAGVVAVAGPRIAQDVVDGQVEGLEADVAAATGGDVEVALSGSPVDAVRQVVAGGVPAGTVVVTDGRLPDDGVRFRRAELLVDGADVPGSLTLWLPPAAIEEQVDVDGVGVLAEDGQLLLDLGLLAVPVTAEVVDGRVALGVPGLPAPFDVLVADTLSDLVPEPPDGVTLTDVTVTGGELVVVGAVELDAFLAELGAGA